ncbi:hypothetical protein TNCV_1669491 [Trichonephila clavipes]|nr:hypothetical protein TNCV_1669491 [Trichonephila clavipes]
MMALSKVLQRKDKVFFLDINGKRVSVSIDRPELILSMDKLNLDQAPQDINKEEFQLERVRLQAFAAATDPGCKTELIRSGSLSGFI